MCYHLLPNHIKFDIKKKKYSKLTAFPALSLTHFRKDNTWYALTSTVNHEPKPPAGIHQLMHLKTSHPTVPFCIKFRALCFLRKTTEKEEKGGPGEIAIMKQNSYTR